MFFHAVKDICTYINITFQMSIHEKGAAKSKLRLLHLFKII